MSASVRVDTDTNADMSVGLRMRTRTRALMTMSWLEQDPIRDRRPGRIFATAFSILFVLCAAWAFCTPLGASPDEPSHLVKAAATARGEINGISGFLTQQMAQGPTEQPARFYRVPEAYEQLSACYVNMTEVCLKPIRPSDKTALAPTTAGHYNPIYYAAVGWPSLFVTGEHGMYLVRLMSALLNSLLLAGAFTLAARWRRPAFALAGLAVATTPMVIYLGGVVNPNSVEASAAILAWTAVLSLTMQPDRELVKARMISLGVSAAVLANARPLGFEWTAAILGIAFLAARPGAVRAIVRDRLTWLVGGIAAVPMLSGLLWTLTHGDNAKVPFVPDNAFLPAAHATLRYTQAYIDSMVGNFGWLDTPSPAVTDLFWIGAAVTLLVLACALGRLREKAAALAILLGTIFIPVLAQGIQAKHIGMVWQGRYLLAFAVGLPLVTGMTVAVRGTFVPDRAQRRITVTLTVMLGFANFTAFFHALRRYMVGLNGRVIPRPISWEPPGTWMLWLPVFAIALSGLVILAARLSVNEDLSGLKAGGRSRLMEQPSDHISEVESALS
jgi:hypothetical protein